MSVEELQKRVKELEAENIELRKVKHGGTTTTAAREKIPQMSGEVVDTNPYRYSKKGGEKMLLNL